MRWPLCSITISALPPIAAAISSDRNSGVAASVPMPAMGQIAGVGGLSVATILVWIFRHFAHAQHRIAVEVRSLDGTVLDRELLDERGRQTIYDRTFQLAVHVVGLDHQARIDGDAKTL